MSVLEKGRGSARKNSWKATDDLGLPNQNSRLEEHSIFGYRDEGWQGGDLIATCRGRKFWSAGLG